MTLVQLFQAVMGIFDISVRSEFILGALALFALCICLRFFWCICVKGGESWRRDG